MEMVMVVVAMALNMVILFYLVRKATRADAQIDLLKQILAAQKPQEKSEIVKLTEERNLKGLS
ncbi:hypothetical protein NQI61_004033 [Salmonella enterica]|nr:hypothetical protein [Salmonella enterica]ELP9742233.1 hypothetical protein [Salmonella enterica]ELR1491021.1 hypothetical protein [Salmonella enterica]